MLEGRGLACRAGAEASALPSAIHRFRCAVHRWSILVNDSGAINCTNVQYCTPCLYFCTVHVGSSLGARNFS